MKKRSKFWDLPDQLQGKTFKKIIVQFSGGIDSTASLIWAKTLYKGKAEIEGVFCDTGVEFPTLFPHLYNVCKRLDVNLKIIKPEREWWTHWVASRNWPNIIYLDCAGKFVHGPFNKYAKSEFKKYDILILDGSRKSESLRISKQNNNKTDDLRSGCKKIPTYHPCFYMNKPLLLLAIKESQIPIWEGYHRGFVRTACWCCPGQSRAQATALQENYPGLCNTIRWYEKLLGPMCENEKPPQTFNDMLGLKNCGGEV